MIWELSRRYLLASSLSVLLNNLQYPLHQRLRVQASLDRRLLIGVNMAGAEFGSDMRASWSFPDFQRFAYFLEAGFNVFRIPFRWERLHDSVVNGKEDANMRYLLEVINKLCSYNKIVILDMHNFMRWHSQDEESVVSKSGSGPASLESLAGFWLELGRKVRHLSDVWFGLMNEPYDIEPNTNAYIQTYIARHIRSEGIDNRILLSGSSWSGAHSWVSSGNAAAYENGVSELRDVSFDMHQYLDKDSGGSSPYAVVGSGRTRLVAATEWLRMSGHTAFLGEFASGSDMVSLSELRSMLAVLEENRDVWLGGTYWAGGGRWSDKDVFSIDPNSNGLAKAQMLVLEKIIQSQ